MPAENDKAGDGGARTPKRVLAAFGSIADELETIEAALALAQALSAEIAGYFVEESSLIDLAGLPFAKAIQPASRVTRSIETSEMEQQFVRAAAEWRRLLGSRAGRSRISHTFVTVRGDYCAEIAKVAMETDIVVLNPASLSQRGQASMLKAMGRAAGIVLLPERRPIVRHGPVVLIASEPPDPALLQLNKRIAETLGARPVVLIRPGGVGSAAKIRTAVEAELGADTRVETLPGTDPSETATAIAGLHPSFIIWSGEDGGEREMDLTRLLRESGAPVVLLRRAG